MAECLFVEPWRSQRSRGRASPKAETPEIKVVPAPPAPEPPALAAPAAPEPKEKEKKPLGLRSIFDSLLAWLAFSAFSVDASQDRFRTCGTPASRILCCEGEQGQCEPAELVALGLRAARSLQEGGKLGGGLDASQEDCCVAWLQWPKQRWKVPRDRMPRFFRRVDLGGALDRKSLGWADNSRHSRTPRLYTALRGVRVYDRVVKVNGEAKKSSELVRRIQEATDLELYMERPKVKARRTEGHCWNLPSREKTYSCATTSPASSVCVCVNSFLSAMHRKCL